MLDTGEVNGLGVDTERATGGGFWRRPRGACSRHLSGAVELRTFTFPSSPAGAKDQPRPSQRPEDYSPSG
jgi:hypothetical protein